MNWLFQLHDADPVAHAIGILALVCLAGMALGSLKLRGIGLGSAGVLFAGIVAGHFGKPVDRETLAFVKELGLLLFVFMIGLQQGPGFFTALRKQGVKMNALAAATVLIGAAGAPLIGHLAGFDPAAVLGIFSGSSFNMPSLGAATQALNAVADVDPDRAALPALACAVTFPMAIVSSIGVLLLLKRIFRIDPAQEAADTAAKQRRTEPLEHRTLIVTNPNLDSLTLDDIPGRRETGVTISRLRHGSETQTAAPSSIVRYGDHIAAVGTRPGLDQFERVVGQRIEEDLEARDGRITSRRLLVTAKGALGHTVSDLNLENIGVVATKIERAGLEMAATPALRLQFGDAVEVVGREEDLDRASETLGNSLKALNETHFIPLFIGIFLGVALGTWPIAVAGLPQPVRLGLAGGPLIVALIIGRFGRIGRMPCHMPLNANVAFREFGMALFFAAVGLDAGAKFFQTVFSRSGVEWLLAGVCLTTGPLLLTGIFARVVCRLPFTDVSGLLAGSSTNPPALAFATNLARSDAPTVAYATVYPLTMLLRVLCAQVMALVLMR